MSDRLKHLARGRNLALILLILVIAAGVGGWLYSHRDNGPIPRKISHSANFALYYPSTLPVGYQLDKASVRLDSGVVFYTIEGGAGRQVFISEQSLPANPPDLQQLETLNTSLKNISAPAGQAILGVDPESKSPVAILMTNTSLINVNASKITPSDAVTKIVQAMTSLPQ